VKRYEGLFILNTAGREEGVPALVEKVSAEIAAAGGRIETTQKMDKRQFARVADKKFTSGFYVNIIFTAPPPTLDALRSRFALNSDVFRVQFSHLRATTPTPVAAGAAA
jgi:ribosomal protein S6